MKWFWLATRDQASNNWILYKDSFLSLRPRYSRFCCPNCGKVNEDAALLLGFDEDVFLRSHCDIFHSSDGILCFSKRAKDVWQSNNVKGLRFLSLPKPNKRGHEVAVPTITVPVNRDKSGFQWTDYPSETQPEPEDEEVFCLLCRRPRKGAYVGPFLESMALPEDPLCVITPSLSPESLRGKVYWVLVSDVVKDIIQKSRLIGTEFIEPH